MKWPEVFLLREAEKSADFSKLHKFFDSLIPIVPLFFNDLVYFSDELVY